MTIPHLSSLSTFPITLRPTQHQVGKHWRVETWLHSLNKSLRHSKSTSQHYSFEKSLHKIRFIIRKSLYRKEICVDHHLQEVSNAFSSASQNHSIGRGLTVHVIEAFLTLWGRILRENCRSCRRWACTSSRLCHRRQRRTWWVFRTTFQPFLSFPGTIKCH